MYMDRCDCRTILMIRDQDLFTCSPRVHRLRLYWVEVAQLPMSWSIDCTFWGVGEGGNSAVTSGQDILVIELWVGKTLPNATKMGSLPRVVRKLAMHWMQANPYRNLIPPGELFEYCYNSVISPFFPKSVKYLMQTPPQRRQWREGLSAWCVFEVYARSRNRNPGEVQIELSVAHFNMSDLNFGTQFLSSMRCLWEHISPTDEIGTCGFSVNFCLFVVFNAVNLRDSARLSEMSGCIGNVTRKSKKATIIYLHFICTNALMKIQMRGHRQKRAQTKNI